MTAAIDPTAPLRPDRSEFGAPDVAAYRNPTVWVFAAALACWTGAAAMYADPSIHWTLSTALATLGTYLGFTVLHESVHRVAHRRSRVNDAMGWLPGLMLFFTMPVFRVCHTKHHANTNDPEKDPDHSVANMPAWLRPWWLVYTVYNYRRLYYSRRWWRDGRQLAQQIALDVVVVVTIIATLVTDRAAPFGVLWLMPALFAGMFLFYTFDFLPHKPHDSTERFHDTRIQPGRLRHAVLLGQNYHLVHHLWVAIPWYRYRHVFEDLREELEARDIRID